MADGRVGWVGAGREGPVPAIDAARHAAEFVRAFRDAAGRPGRGGGAEPGEGRRDDVAWHSNVFVWGEERSMKAMQLVAIGESLTP